MIANKILRNLTKGKKYLLYDSLTIYILTVNGDSFGLYDHSTCINSWSEHFFILEKDFEDLLLDARREDRDERVYFLKNYFIDKGYTNSYKALSSLGFLTLHADFDWYKLKFFGEYKNEETVKELRRFRKIFKN